MIVSSLGTSRLECRKKQIEESGKKAFSEKSHPKSVSLSDVQLLEYLDAVKQKT